MAFCLPKFASEIFKQKLISGEIDPMKLNELSSAERRSFFETFLSPDHAQQTNALFESKLLLKNQQEGLINWAKQLSGLKPEAKRDLISRVSKMDELLNPANEEGFLADLAAQKLGTSVTLDEARNITELSKNVQNTKTQIAPDSPLRSPERLQYGTSLALFKEYIEGLKNEANKNG